MEDAMQHQENLQKTLLLNILSLTLFPSPFNTQVWTAFMQEQKLE